MMKWAIVAILGSVVGGLVSVGGTVKWLGWGIPMGVQSAVATPTRADYVDLLLTLITVFIAAIGLAVTVGALAIGLVALKTLREIKDEAADSAQEAAESKINETMQEVLPKSLRSVLIDEELAHEIMSEMAQKGELDGVLDRVVMRVQGGGIDVIEEEDS